MGNVRVGSVCSSVGGMDLGFERAGYTTQWVCEVDPWRRKILAKHFPQAEQHDDLTTLDPAVLAPVDVLIGGTPCQDLSHAGNRAGLEGERSRLFWDYMRIRNHMNIPWAVWENVYGALTSNGGLDFASVLGAFVGCPVDVPAGGWPGAGVATGPWGGCCWRVLDAQHFGVPQRRRRVFVVGHLGGECPPEILFESEGGAGHLAACGEAGANAPDGLGGGVAGTLDKRRGGADDNEAQAGQLIVGTITKRVGKGVDSDGLGMPLIAHTLRAAGFDASEDGSGRGTPLVLGEPARGSSGSSDHALSRLPSSADRVDSAPAHPDRVRTPDGLAGIVDGAVSAFDPLPDGRRYSACGDGVVAPVAEWIGNRLAAVMDGQVPPSGRPS